MRNQPEEEAHGDVAIGWAAENMMRCLGLVAIMALPIAVTALPILIETILFGNVWVAPSVAFLVFWTFFLWKTGFYRLVLWAFQKLAASLGR